MTLYPFNPGALGWNPNGHPAGSFFPEGRLMPHGLARNPVTWKAKKNTLVGRLIVGFNVGGTPTWTLDDLIPIVKQVRTRQTGDPSASFVAQQGVYRHLDGSVVDENGAQVFIISDTDKKKKFRKQMVELAEIIASRLKQESVIVEIQKDGISQGTMGVAP